MSDIFPTTFRHPKSPWTEARIDQLKVLWRDGGTLNAIAAELGVARGAISGKVHRLGLARPSVDRRTGPRATPHKPRKPKQTTPQQYAKPPPLPTSEDAPMLAGNPTDHEIPHTQRRQFFELTQEACRWPVGDPGTDAFFFCGGTALTGRPYCRGHCQVAYRVRVG